MKKLISQIKNNKNIIIIFILVLLISCTFLCVGDDWAWGTGVGIERLNNWFKDYNGRYLSNLLIILISRLDSLRILTTAITTTLIIVYLKKVSNTKKDVYPLIFLLIFSTPINIFKNTIAWASGFVNYVLPILLVLIFLNYIKRINTKEINNKFTHTIFMFILGIASCLIVEHITIYCVALIIFVNIYYFIKYKKISKLLVSYSIGVIIGTTIMFSNGAYLKVATGEDFYRTAATSVSFIEKISTTFFDTIYINLIFNNYIVNIIISILLIYITLQNENKHKKLLKAISLIPSSYTLYTILKIINPNWNIFGNLTTIFEGITTIIYCLAVLYITIFNNTSKKYQKEKLAFILISVVIIAGPLLVVTPVTPRCFFPCYIMICLYIIQLIKYLKVYKNKYNYIITSISIMFYIFWLSITSYNMLNNIRRDNYINEQIKKGATKIEIYKLC